MILRSIANGGVVDVDDECAERLLSAGGWAADDAPVKTKRTRRTKAQIAADAAAEEAEQTQE